MVRQLCGTGSIPKHTHTTSVYQKTSPVSANYLGELHVQRNLFQRRRNFTLQHGICLSSNLFIGRKANVLAGVPYVFAFLKGHSSTGNTIYESLFCSVCWRCGMYAVHLLR